MKISDIKIQADLEDYCEDSSCDMGCELYENELCKRISDINNGKALSNVLAFNRSEKLAKLLS